MRMKKLLILSAAVLGAVACSNTYEVKTAPEKAIGFGTWTETLTKARVQGSNTFTNGDDFAVYGFKVNGTTNNTVFNGEVVSTTNGNSWTYTPVRYWDPSATSYTFYAVSPATIGTAATATTVDPETGEMTSTSITFAGNDNDVLVADKTAVDPADFNKTVEIKFNHIASLVDFKVKKHTELGNATLAITSFSISNIDNVGTFSVNDAYTSNKPVVTWNATGHAGNYSNTSGVKSVATLPTAVGTTGDFLINNLVAMPQTFRTDANIQTVSIDYTITDENSIVSTYSTSFNLKLFDNEDDKDNLDTIIESWEAGKHYTFFITINANKIDFTASINPWTADVSGYNYLIK